MNALYFYRFHKILSVTEVVGRTVEGVVEESEAFVEFALLDLMEHLTLLLFEKHQDFEKLWLNYFPQHRVTELIL